MFFQATQCVYAMDKFVVFVVLMVLSNHMVLFANAIHPRARLVFIEPILSAANSNAVQYAAAADQGDFKASKPQVSAQQAAPPQPINFKNQFIDSIFQVRATLTCKLEALVWQSITLHPLGNQLNYLTLLLFHHSPQIPIATLKAVNNLVLTFTNGIASQVPVAVAASPAKSTVVLDSAAHSSAPVAVRGDTATSATRTSPVVVATLTPEDDETDKNGNSDNTIRRESPGPAAATNNRPVVASQPGTATTSAQ